MSRKRIGLDIGSSSLKCVILEESLRGLRVSQCREVSLRLGPNPLERKEGFAEAVRQLIPGWELRDAEVFVAIPSHQVSWHGIHLPFRHTRQIAKVIKYEIAQSVPYELEDVVTDFFIPSAEGRGGAVVTGACVAREKLIMYRNLLQAAGIVPVEITSEALAMYYSYLVQEPEPPQGCVALIDIGASKTTVCIVRHGSFFGASSIYKGGDWVTRRLGEERGISFEEAEEMKLNPDPNHQAALDHAYDDFLNSLGDSVEHCVLAQTASQGESEAIAEVVLGGGCARVPRVLDYLGKRLGVPARLANPFEGLSTAVFLPAHVAGPLFHVATGLALAASYRGKARIDLQKAALREHEPQRGLRRTIIPVAVAIVALLALAVGNLCYKLHSKERRYQLLTEQVNAVFASTFPDAPLIVDARKQMMSQVRRVEAELKSLDEVPAPAPMLELLRELSDLVPEDTELLIADLTLSNRRMRFRGETVSFDAVDTLRARLAESEHFGDAVINAANTNKRTGKITFTLSASY